MVTAGGLYGRQALGKELGETIALFPGAVIVFSRKVRAGPQLQTLGVVFFYPVVGGDEGNQGGISFTPGEPCERLFLTDGEDRFGIGMLPGQ